MKKSVKNGQALSFMGYIIISGISVLCVLPFVVVLSSSFSSQESLLKYGYPLIPRYFSLEGYKAILQNPVDILNAYCVTIYATCVGTIIGMFLTSMASYVLWRKDFPWRNSCAFFLYFTTLFSGGLVPYYILCVQYLHFKQLPLIAVVVPGFIGVFNIIIIRNFMKSIPDSIVESAKMDGGGDFMIFVRLVLPLSKPALASIGLFVAFGYWNDWYTSFLFITNPRYYQLQYYLYRMINSAEISQRYAQIYGISISELPTETMKMAMTIVVIGPIIFLYPFLQKYFVKGLTIGAVKG